MEQTHQRRLKSSRKARPTVLRAPLHGSEPRGARAQSAAVHERIMRVLGELPRPLSAYALLEALKDGAGRRVYPQTVYRALNALIAQGLVHKLGSVNAFLACAHPHRPHDGIHLICDGCGVSEEVVDRRVTALLDKAAEGAHFTRQRQSIELHGLCGNCSPA
jgi:Fur family zinc uptake transcriptional regulator